MTHKVFGLVLTTALLIAAGSAQAVTLVGYDFNSNNGNFSQKDADITASTFTGTFGTQGFDGTIDSRDEAGEAYFVSNGRWSFDVSAANPLSLQTLSFDIQNERRGSGRGTEFTVSAIDSLNNESFLDFDFFISNVLTADNVSSVKIGQDGDYLGFDDNEGSIVVDLSSLAPDTAYQLRIYGANTGSLGGFASLDDVVLEGQILTPAVPEPMTAGLAVLGLAGLAMRRRRVA